MGNYVEDIMNIEQWSQFTENESKRYYVSTLSNVKSVDKTTGEERIVKATKKTNGYMGIATSNPRQDFYLHRLVAEAFIPNPENKPTVNHIHGLDAGDNVENLEWATYAEQQEHARKTGLITDGKTPMIALNSNGEIIAQHETRNEALTHYNGRNVYYNKDVQIIGNVIVMKQAYYNELTEDEVFNICSDCFERMLKFIYVVDGQLADNAVKASEMINCEEQMVRNRTINKWSADINGHTVSRLSNLLGVGTHDEG